MAADHVVGFATLLSQLPWISVVGRPDRELHFEFLDLYTDRDANFCRKEDGRGIEPGMASKEAFTSVPSLRDT